jgi:hypothetical protein
LDQIAASSAEATRNGAAPASTEPPLPPSTSAKSHGDWGRHPLNLRVSLPLPFGRWYVTLIAGRERRGAERLVEERDKHPLDTVPNVLFLFSAGIISTALLLLGSAFFLIHGLGWSIHLTIPS